MQWSPVLLLGTALGGREGGEMHAGGSGVEKAKRLGDGRV